MADRWMDDRDRQWRERDRRRSDDMNRGEGRFTRGEDRSFGSDEEDDRYYGARRSGQDRDRVFGERETGMGYGGEDMGSGRGMQSGGGAYGAGGSYGGGESYGREGRVGGGRGSAYRGGQSSMQSGMTAGRSGQGGQSGMTGGATGGGRGGWQDRDYGGVSPAMRQGEYDAERQAERYDREHGYGERGQEGRRAGGRYYGDAGREPIYREEWSQGRRDYGPAPRGYDAGQMDSDHRRGHFSEDYSGSMFGSGDMSRGGGQGGMWSGGTGGYDYERGYGDGGRQAYDRDREDRGERWEQRGREMGRDTGDFFRRASERVASWFGGGEHETERGRDERYDERGRSFRGMGPKGYKRADERISDEVHERLTEDPYVDASNISVSVSGGEVTLSGTVENREAKHRAERCVEDISGVSHVQNNLRIEQGNPLTSAGRGYGDSVLDHQMRGETGAGESLGGSALAGSGSSAVGGSQGSDGGVSGLSGRTSTGAAAETTNTSTTASSTAGSSSTGGRTTGGSSTDTGKSR